MDRFVARARSALAAWSLPPDPQVVAIEGGLINRTFDVRAGDTRAVLQWVNPLFDPRIHDDIDAVTAHLERGGLLTPRLIRTLAGTLWIDDDAGGAWRLWTFVAGHTLHRVTEPAIALSAGALVGRFHAAVSTLACEFRYARKGTHDTPAHLARLEATLEARREHALYEAIAPLAEGILREVRALDPLPAAPLRVAHGDLKISNLLFDDERNEAIALIDLDTVSKFPLAVEMGDALRSWCNPLGEDEPAAVFRADIFEAAVFGYTRATSELLLAVERGSLVLGTRTIALELASRFCRDALEESYFGWDPTRFPSRSEHNRVRAESQLALADSIGAQRGALEAIVARACGSR